LKKLHNFYRILYFLPRMLGILAILFISLFSLDVFEAGLPLINMLVGFSIHMIPSFILTVILIIAWKHERIGGLLFIGVSLIPFILFSNPFWVNLVLGGPFFAVGVLFVIHHYVSRH
jgi:hypothetical protein